MPAAVLLLVALGLGYYLVQFKIRSNFQEVIPHKVYRSGQPTPDQLRQWSRRFGIRTVMSLRGRSGPVADEEQAAADASGIRLITFDLSAYQMPPQPILSGIIYELEHAELPILIHCLHGIDRAGAVSALAAMALGDVAYDQAKRQAYVPPGPWKRRKGSGHISDLFTLYEQYCRAGRLNTNDWQTFKSWAANVYQPSYHSVDVGIPAVTRTPPGDSLGLSSASASAAVSDQAASSPKRSLCEISASPTKTPSAVGE